MYLPRIPGGYNISRFIGVNDIRFSLFLG
ncbi:unnamed protein product [Acanthoscelides obtectus]|uniref:Uncharacterized protein n=1 Tax=Acanthoscelides obtectus TaxID=200917 RepID=A0A9P0MED5_ACAOB|nr:unnamed protein product [Acanthoscelides obtectus]CAK1645965.1 hypothetical protein AOBTE_LOCUS14362 [Acanthoscelides obtectus]